MVSICLSLKMLMVLNGSPIVNTIMRMAWNRVQFVRKLSCISSCLIDHKTWLDKESKHFLAKVAQMIYLCRYLAPSGNQFSTVSVPAACPSEDHSATAINRDKPFQSVQYNSVVVGSTEPIFSINEFSLFLCFINILFILPGVTAD